MTKEADALRASEGELQLIATGANIHRINNVRQRLIAIATMLERGDKINLTHEMATAWKEIGEWFSMVGKCLEDGKITAEEADLIDREWVDVESAVSGIHGIITQLKK